MNEVIEKQEQEKLYILLLKYMDEVSLTEFQENYTQQFIEHCIWLHFITSTNTRTVETSKWIHN